jgi:light-regulated signal transduction histidine kinase (bacteriophytochrome)
MSRSVLRSLGQLSRGLQRFGAGDFSEPVSVTGNDELSGVARDANQMAGRIKDLVRELDSFSSSVAHDLRAPLRGISGFSSILLEEHGAALSPDARSLLERVIAAARKMGLLIDSLLNLSRLARTELKRQPVDLSALAREILAELAQGNPERKVTTRVDEGAVVRGDPQLLQVVLVNLLSNAWKFSAKNPQARVEFGRDRASASRTVYFVRDNGAGFDMQHAAKLFGTFQRLHSAEEFEGTGIGLVTVQSIIRRHGGDIWADAKPGEGATFFFTVGKSERA